MKTKVLLFITLLFSFCGFAQETTDATIDKGSGILYFSAKPGTTPSSPDLYSVSEFAMNTAANPPELWVWNRANTAWERQFAITQGTAVPTVAPATGLPRTYIRTTTGAIYVYNGSAWVELGAGGGGGTDDQTAVEVSFSATGNILSSDVQSMGEELQTQIDGLQTTSGVVNGATNLGTFSGSTISDNTTTKAALQELETAVESGGGGGGNINNVCEEKIFKVAHGFSIGSVIFLDKNGNWVESQANTDSTIHDAIIISVPHVDTFNIQFCGLADITGQTYTVGVDYYTSETTAGDLRSTTPTEGYVDFVGVGRGGTKIQLKDVNAVYTGTDVPENSFLLDDVSTSGGANAAYSLRKLSASYSGFAIEVRRTSDNTKQDIGFNGSGDLDESALSTFCASTDCHVTTWYDQSGNSNDATNSADDSTQPVIVESGTILTDGSHPAIRFDSQNLDSDGFSDLGAYSFFGVAKCYDYLANSNSHYLVNAGGGEGFATLRNVSGGRYAYRHQGSFNTFATNVASIFTPQDRQLFNAYRPNNTSITAYINNTQITLSTPSAANNTNISTHNIGGILSSKWIIQEIVIWPTDESSVRLDILSNINTYYTIY